VQTNPDLEMGSVVFKLGVTLFFVLLNGFFVAAEFALVKVRVSRIHTMAAQGHRQAKAVSHLLNHLDLYLSGCQLGITVASLILGWLAEPAIAELLLAGATWVGIEPQDPTILHGVALAIALTLVTIMHMTLGEQAPKIWAIKNAERGAFRAARLLRWFTLVLRPLIWFINRLSNWVLKLIGVPSGVPSEGTHSAEELREVLAASAQAGHITRRQRELADNILGFIDLEVRHVLVPRIDVAILATSRKREENLQTIRETGHSRFPICKDDLDSAIGVIHTKDVLRSLLDGSDASLEELARPIPIVPESQPLGRLIGELQRKHTEVAVVLDERGTAVGLVFLEDALEEIVGPIQDEFDQEEGTLINQVSPDVWEVRGHVPLPDAIGLLGLEASDEHDTIGGLVISELGRLPSKGDSLEIGPYRVTVTGVLGGRVLTVRFEKLPEEPEASE
jgi:CBS domain containing-hemolysin-like protein